MEHIDLSPKNSEPYRVISQFNFFPLNLPLHIITEPSH